MNRRKLIIGGASLSVLGIGGFIAWRAKANKDKIGFEPNAEFIEKAKKLINQNPMIDTHAHPGRFFVKDSKNTSLPFWIRTLLRNTFEEKAIADIQETKMSAVAFAGVADIDILGMKKSGSLYNARNFAQGEAWESYGRQIKHIKEVLTKNKINIALNPDDIRAAIKNHALSAILTFEGADFLEGKIERIKEIYDNGIRSVTIVHYTASEIGDIQTQTPIRGGLTEFGIAAVKEMQNQGIIIDLAHAAEPTAFKALENVSVPVICSHTHINGGASGEFPRFISNELAQAIVKGGGIIGAWPTGVKISTISGFVDRIFELSQKVGTDAISIGTDMGANYKPVVTKYVDLILVVSELLRRGMNEADVVKFMGGNFLRVFDKIQAARKV
ncbi:MAG: membrane dipeptidase [Caulobacterales bacterium]|nr:membrane dipeptidase [Caulobacterales bacterium]MCA0373544.1 dipeptidase [Pseudomonadota bacterium]